MRIVQIVTEFLPAIGGVERHVYEISKGLVRRGHEVTILTSNLLKENPFTKFSGKTSLSIHGISVRRFNAYRVLPLRAGIIMPSMIAELMNLQTDILHAHGYGRYPLMVASAISKLRKIPFVVTTHAIQSPFGLPEFVKVGYNLLLGIFTLRSANRIIAITRTESSFLSSLGIPPEKISVIPNGIDLQLFRRSQKQLLPRFLKENTPYILYVGRIDKHKGLAYLLRAFPRVLKKYPGMRLVLVGEDWGFKDELNTVINNLGINENVVFTGSISQQDLLKAYSSAKLFVLPSVVEAFGIVLLEAMAYRLPIVATTVGGIPDVIEHGRNGLLIRPTDINSLSDAIVKMLGDGKLRETIATNNELDVRRYDWGQIVKEIETCYKRSTNIS